MTDLPSQADVVIVGAGPAGLAAATVLRQCGVQSVVVLDREDQAGGVPRHCLHSPYGLREFRRPMTGPRYAKALVKAAKTEGLSIHTGVTVTKLLPGPMLQISSDAGPTTLQARAVLLATGAREASRAERMIGGTKPQGVISTGALQLILASGQKPFHRPAILGTELVSFSALLSCKLAGIHPVAMIEPSERTTARRPIGLFPKVLGIPLLTQTDVTEVEGRSRVTALRLSTGQTLKADGLIVTGQFQPDAPLLADSCITVDALTGGPEIDQYGRCSEAGYFAAGNLLRAVETAGWSWAEGRRIAAAIHAHLSGLLAADLGQLIRMSGPLSALVPQRIAPGPAIGLDALQLRVNTPVSGTLCLLAGASVIVSKRLHSRPERRVLLPLPSYGSELAVQLNVTDPT
jgi:NADPH-dependent 2,4-dienoyl-CoA reductase/sulfur reductase-like enzyme